MVYISTNELIRVAKASLGISTPNSEMTDEEIRHTVVWASKLVYHHIDLILILALSAIEFPEFFSRYELAEPN